MNFKPVKPDVIHSFTRFNKLEKAHGLLVDNSPYLEEYTNIETELIKEEARV